MATNKSNQNNSTNTTNYNFYYDQADKDKLVDSLLDLFVHAFIKIELDTMTSKRSNGTLNNNELEDKTQYE